MINSNIQQYDTYYESILKSQKKIGVQFVILTHIVSDVTPFISAVSNIGKIALIIAIPYSRDKSIYAQLSKKYTMRSPALEKLSDSVYLTHLVTEQINLSKPLIIVEIGGYFAAAASEIHKKTNGNLIGIIEDTEAGHRRYETLNGGLPCPVLSVARSHLKNAENFLVGSSCAKAAAAVLKKINFEMWNKNALVLGYGKIGQGLCQLLKERNLNVSTYDSDPAKRLLALSRGYPIPEKREALKWADLVFGATGTQSITSHDTPFIKNKTILLSCSSKRIEFDLKFIKTHYKKTKTNHDLDQYTRENQNFYVVGDGQPINFACGKILVGPIISLVHGEMLAAITELTSEKYENTLQEIPNELKKTLAENWIATFCNTTNGTYLYE